MTYWLAARGSAGSGDCGVREMWLRLYTCPACRSGQCHAYSFRACRIPSANAWQRVLGSAICFDCLSLIELKIGNWALPTPHPVRKQHLARYKKRLQNGVQSERFRGLRVLESTGSTVLIGTSDLGLLDGVSRVRTLRVAKSFRKSAN